MYKKLLLLVTIVLISNHAFSKSNSRLERYADPYIEALSDTYPWIAQQLNSYGRWCTAVLVSDKHVLTSAHCVDRAKEVENLEIEFLNAAIPFKRKVIRFIKNHNASNNIYSDIAILEIENPISTIITPSYELNVSCPTHLSIKSLMTAGYAGERTLKLVHLQWLSCSSHGFYSLDYDGYIEGGDSGRARLPMAPLF